MSPFQRLSPFQRPLVPDFDDGLPSKRPDEIAKFGLYWGNDILENDGSGRIYQEIGEEARRWTNGTGQQVDVSLVGYSHRGGMIYNLSQKIKTDANLAGKVRVVYSGTIDAVRYGTGTEGWYNPKSLTDSPLTGWATPARGKNWYETIGWIPYISSYVPWGGSGSTAHLICGSQFRQSSNVLDVPETGTASNHSDIQFRFDILIALTDDIGKQYDDIGD